MKFTDAQILAPGFDIRMTRETRHEYYRRQGQVRQEVIARRRVFIEWYNAFVRMFEADAIEPDFVEDI